MNKVIESQISYLSTARDPTDHKNVTYIKLLQFQYIIVIIVSSYKSNSFVLLCPENKHVQRIKGFSHLNYFGICYELLMKISSLYLNGLNLNKK